VAVSSDPGCDEAAAEHLCPDVRDVELREWQAKAGRQLTGDRIHGGDELWREHPAGSRPAALRSRRRGGREPTTTLDTRLAFPWKGQQAETQPHE